MFLLYQCQPISYQVCVILHDDLPDFTALNLFGEGFCSRNDDESFSHLERFIIVKAWPKILLQKCLVITNRIQTALMLRNHLAYQYQFLPR